MSFLFKTNPNSFLFQKSQAARLTAVENSNTSEDSSNEDQDAAIAILTAQKRLSLAVSQATTAAPTSSNILNQVGTITWARTSAGLYTMTHTGGFPGAIIFQPLSGLSGTTQFFVNIVRTSANVLTMTVKGTDGNPVEGVLSSVVINLIALTA